MVSRTDKIRQNQERNKYTIKNNPNKNNHPKNKRYKRYGGKHRKHELDEMDKFIEQLNTYKSLKNVRVDTITNITDGWAYKTAQYFKDKLNTSQLRSIHHSIKNIDKQENTWENRQLLYQLLIMDVGLKNEKKAISNKFYRLLNVFFNIINGENENEAKNEDLNKLIIFLDAFVGYHKYFENRRNNIDQTLNGLLLTINEEYLSNISKNNDYMIDSEKIATLLYKKENQITIHQIRKIFNVFKRMQRENKKDWNNIEEYYYKLYPKLAYMLGRGLITEGYFNLLIRSMNIINQGRNKEKILKLNNFIIYLESIIGYIAYQKRLASL